MYIESIHLKGSDVDGCDRSCIVNANKFEFYIVNISIYILPLSQDRKSWSSSLRVKVEEEGHGLIKLGFCTPKYEFLAYVMTIIKRSSRQDP